MNQTTQKREDPPRNLQKKLDEEFVRYGLMVPPDYRLPDSWHMSEGELPMPPLPDADTEEMEDLKRKGKQEKV